MRDLVRALKFLRPYWAVSLGAVASLAVVSAANLLFPQLLRAVIDQGIARGEMSAVVASTLGLLGIAVVRGVFTFFQGYLSERASQGAAFDLRNLLYGKLQTLSFSYHDQAQTGQLMTRVTSDVEMVRQFVGQGFLMAVGAVLMLGGAAVVLVVMNWRLALVALATLPIVFVAMGAFIGRGRPLFTTVQVKLSALNTILQENLAGVRVVKAFVREAYESSRYVEANRELLVENLKVVKVFSFAFPSMFFLFGLGNVAVLWYGGSQVVDGQISLGELVAFTAYLNYLMFPMFMLGMITTLIARAGASARRIFEVADAESEVHDRPDALPLPPIQGRVTFEGVSFKYVGAERDAITDVSFDVSPGQTVAVVGTTGSGKSTIINLIPRFYDATEGRVLVDGRDVREVTLDSLRGKIGIVLQETVLFSGTIGDNIAYGAPAASPEDVERSARMAQAHDFVAALPEGYESRIGEGGVGLSGGQQQRIAIARALLLDPPLLILDDSTSSVDAETEYQIQRAMDQLMGSRTTFIVAQRISTVRKADLILVLDNSRLVASGTHEELLATSALYGEIAASQLRDDTADLVGAVEAEA